MAGATYSSVAVSPSGTTLLSTITQTTTAGTVLAEVVVQPGAGTLGYGQVTVLSTGAATAIAPARTTRTSLLISVAGTTNANLYFGDSSVISTTGLLVLGIKGASFPLPTSAALYAVTDGSANNIVSYLETYL
jgi:hypothetical protein